MTHARRSIVRWSAAGAIASLIVSLALVGVVSVPASADTTAPSSSAPEDGLTFTVGVQQAVDSFNPFNGINATSFEIWALMYDYMITYSDKDMAPEPGLAESWDTSADGKTWTFHIRTGVKWSDGEDLTAQDIAFTYNRILDGGPESGTWGSYLASVDKITAPDDTTVVLSLGSPNAVLPLLPIPIVPEHIWKDISEKDIKSYPNEPVDGTPTSRLGPVPRRSKVGLAARRFTSSPTPTTGRASLRSTTSTSGSTDRKTPWSSRSRPARSTSLRESAPCRSSHSTARRILRRTSAISPGFNEIAFNTGVDRRRHG